MFREAKQKQKDICQRTQQSAVSKKCFNLPLATVPKLFFPRPKPWINDSKTADLHVVGFSIL